VPDWLSASLHVRLVQVSLAMSARHSGSSFVPQQRMLRFISHKTKTAAYFNLKPSKVREQTYTITVTPNTVEKQIGSQVDPDCVPGLHHDWNVVD